MPTDQIRPRHLPAFASLAVSVHACVPPSLGLWPPLLFCLEINSVGKAQTLELANLDSTSALTTYYLNDLRKC